MSYVSTLIGPVDEEFLASVDSAITKNGFSISGRRELNKNSTAVDIHFESSETSLEGQFNQIKQDFYELSTNGKNVDIISQKNDANRQNRGLFVFDMDSTLIQQEVIDMIAAYANVEEQVSEITSKAMNGEIDFNESLKRRVGLLKGIRGDVFELLKPQIKFTPGAHDLCKALKKSGCKLAVLSGGFLPLANWVKTELGLDYAYANVLEIENNVLTGNTIGTIVNGEQKATLLQQIARSEAVDLSRVTAVGDGSNDLPMMKVAGFGVAFNAKPKVQKLAPSKLNKPSLKDILYILGYHEDEQAELLK